MTMVLPFKASFYGNLKCVVIETIIKNIRLFLFHSSACGTYFSRKLRTSPILNLLFKNYLRITEGSKYENFKNREAPKKVRFL